MKFRFEKTQYGWDCYAKQGNAYRYFGHFLTQREANASWIEERRDERHEARLIWIEQGGNIG